VSAFPRGAELLIPRFTCLCSSITTAGVAHSRR